MFVNSEMKCIEMKKESTVVESTRYLCFYYPPIDFQSPPTKKVGRILLPGHMTHVRHPLVDEELPPKLSRRHIGASFSH